MAIFSYLYDYGIRSEEGLHVLYFSDCFSTKLLKIKIVQNLLHVVVVIYGRFPQQ